MALEKILLVDDNEDNLESLEFLLEDMEAEIFRANSGKEALDLVGEHEFAIILMDVAMPEMDGIETTRQIRLKSNVPVIFLTAHAFSDDTILKGYESGAVDYLTKPIQTNALISKVEIFLMIFRQKQLLLAKSKELVESNWKLENEIRQRRELERKIKELSLTYKSALDSSIQVGIIAANKQMQILFMNKTAEGIFNYKNDDVQGKTVYDIHKLENVADSRLEAAIQEVHEKGEHRFIIQQKKEAKHFLDCKIISMLAEEDFEGGYIFSMKELEG